MIGLGTHPPGKKYFKGRIIRDGRVLHYVIWDGIRNYKNAPPLAAIAQAENMQGVQVHLKIGEEAVEDIEELIAAPLCYPEICGLVVWTKNHRIYQLIVRQLTQPGCVWLT